MKRVWQWPGLQVLSGGFRFCSAVAALLWVVVVSADVPVPALAARVTDLSGTLAAGEIAALEQKLAAFETRKGAQIAVLMVATTGPETIEQFGIRVAEAWQLGRKGVDDGVLLLIAKQDRTLRIEVGYGLEGVLPDATANRIIDEIIVPRFRTADFAGGIDAGVERIMALIDGEPLPEPGRSRGADRGLEGIGALLPVVFIFTLTFGVMLKRVMGQLPGALVTGGIVGLLAWMLIGTLFLAFLAALAAFVLTLGSRGGPGCGRAAGVVVQAGAAVSAAGWVAVASVVVGAASVVAVLQGAGESMTRMLRHLLMTRRSRQRWFPQATLAAIKAAIHAGEGEHSGEVRFAIEVFTQLRVWDTGGNNGVLIYLLLADRDIEIVADRGFEGRVEADEWQQICRGMENEFRAGRFEAGTLAGVRQVSGIMARHFPPQAGDRNELSNAPVLFD